MLSLDPVKLLLVAFVALVVLGPDNVPAAARKLSSLLRDLQRLRGSLHEQVRGSLDGLPLSEELGRARDLIGQGRSLDARSLLDRLARETTWEADHRVDEHRVDQHRADDHRAEEDRSDVDAGQRIDRLMVDCDGRPHLHPGALVPSAAPEETSVTPGPGR